MQEDRKSLFDNEGFAIGMLQVVSGGGVLGAVSQAEAIVRLAGRVPFLLFLTATGVTLCLSIIAAFARHQYRMWDIKARASVLKAARANPGADRQRFERDARKRSKWSDIHLGLMRWCMRISVALLCVGVLALVLGSWWYLPASAQVPNLKV